MDIVIVVVEDVERHVYLRFQKGVVRLALLPLGWRRLLRLPSQRTLGLARGLSHAILATQGVLDEQRLAEYFGLGLR